MPTANKISVAGSVQFSAVTQLCATLCDPWTSAHQASLSITNSRSLPKLMSTESVMPSNCLILCRPLLRLPSIFHQVLSNESALRIRWPKYWSFSFIISPSNEQSVAGIFFYYCLVINITIKLFLKLKCHICEYSAKTKRKTVLVMLSKQRNI